VVVVPPYELAGAGFPYSNSRLAI